MKLTRGEIWWLLRRRAGMSQLEAARQAGISEDRMRRWELDREPAPLGPNAHVAAPLTPGEWCAIQRRRAGWTLPKLSRMTGISRMTLWKAEHDRTSGVADLAEWWHRRTRLAPPRAPTPIRVREG